MSNPLGTWDPTLENALEIVAVHAVVLHTGKILFWCFDQRAVGQLGKDNDRFQSFFNNPNLGSYQVWDPATGRASPTKPIGRNSFCAGQCQFPDGTILVLGGQDAAGAADITGEWDKVFQGIFDDTQNGNNRDVQTYDPVADVWKRWPDMADGRYYPTCLTMDDGRAFAVAGLSNLQKWVISGANWAQNDQFEILASDTLFAGATPQRKFRTADQYPIVRQLPGNRILFVHIETVTFLFDLDRSAFIPGAEFVPPSPDGAGQHVGRFTYPMQTGHVLMPQREGETPRILVVGGSTATGFDFNTHSDAPAVLGAFIFDFNPTTPSASRWRMTRTPPTVARLLCDTVLLPDGTVFVVNGIMGGAAAGHSQATVIVAEIFDPATETFRAVAAPDSNHPRGYHSTAFLLPDARVAIAGNTNAYNPGEPNAQDDVSIQIYNPPYLFDGPRPVVTGVPSEIAYGSTLEVDTSAGPAVARAMLMRPCAVTHTVDMDQRAVILDITGGAGRASVRIPNDRTLVPPGYYMLFFLAADNTPSIASWVRVTTAAPSFPPIELGTYSGDAVIREVFDGDVTLEKIDQHCKVTLESRHGSITIRKKIDQHSFADLKAATTVRIGEGIDQHSVVQIVAGGDVTIGQKINERSQASITSGGSINIEQKVDNYSQANLIAQGNVHIGETLDQHSTVRIVSQGEIRIENKIDQHASVDLTSAGAIWIGEKIESNSFANLNAGTTVTIIQKIDQEATVAIVALWNITIGQKIDQHSNADITSANGDISIGQGMSGNATATLRAPNGVISLGEGVDGGSTLNWSARTLNCPRRDGTITHI